RQHGVIRAESRLGDQPPEGRGPAQSPRTIPGKRSGQKQTHARQPNQADAPRQGRGRGPGDGGGRHVFWAEALLLAHHGSISGYARRSRLAACLKSSCSPREGTRPTIIPRESVWVVGPVPGAFLNG